MTYADEYDAWHADWQREALRVLNELDKLRADTLASAQEKSARARRLGTLQARQQADQAWALYRTRSGPLDPLGRPTDPSWHGRAAFQRAWQLATGMPWTHPHDDEPDPLYGEAHARGEHYDIVHPACLDCLDDRLWARFDEQMWDDARIPEPSDRHAHCPWRQCPDRKATR
jgi:hypothetical protein